MLDPGGTGRGTGLVYGGQDRRAISIRDTLHLMTLISDAGRENPEVVGSNPTEGKKLIFQILFIFKILQEICILNINEN